MNLLAPQQGGSNQILNALHGSMPQQGPLYQGMQGLPVGPNPIQQPHQSTHIGSGGHNGVHGNQPGPVMSGAPIPGQPAPGMPNTQFPLNPGAQQNQLMLPSSYGGIGSQLGVIGARPATSSFGLPSY